MPGRTDKTPPTGRPAIAPLVELRDAVVRIGGTEILHGVDLVLTSDENVAILGPNGAGKSTLVGLVVGERRALAVREELIRLGVDPTRVDTISYGKDKPAATGSDEAAWKQNRRDDFIVLTPPK